MATPRLRDRKEGYKTIYAFGYALFADFLGMLLMIQPSGGLDRTLVAMALAIHGRVVAAFWCTKRRTTPSLSRPGRIDAWVLHARGWRDVLTVTLIIFEKCTLPTTRIALIWSSLIIEASYKTATHWSRRSAVSANIALFPLSKRRWIFGKLWDQFWLEFSCHGTTDSFLGNESGVQAWELPSKWPSICSCGTTMLCLYTWYAGQWFCKYWLLVMPSTIPTKLCSHRTMCQVLAIARRSLKKTTPTAISSAPPIRKWIFWTWILDITMLTTSVQWYRGTSFHRTTTSYTKVVKKLSKIRMPCQPAHKFWR